METFSSFNAYIQKAVVENWNQDALTDYQGITLQFHDVARKIEKIHILFENSGIQKGDKIAICGRNSAHWAVAFLATLTYGAVAVPILHEFNGEQIQNIVNHSEAKLLFIGDYAVKTIKPEMMPDLEAIINLPDFSLLISRSEKVTYAREHLNMLFGSKFPRAFRAEHIQYHLDEADELALINYTSGTTGFSKGVMLPYRALWGNVEFIISRLGKKVKPGDSMLSILPMAHIVIGVLPLFVVAGFIESFFTRHVEWPDAVRLGIILTSAAVVVGYYVVLPRVVAKRRAGQMPATK